MKKLHNHRHPEGLERVILRKLPKLLLGSIFIPLFMSVFVRLLAATDSLAITPAEIEKFQTTIDIIGIAIFFMVLSIAFTVTIGCVIVILMKGPAYVADAYDLEDSDELEPKDNNKSRLKM
jgi:hypothetical protein